MIVSMMMRRMLWLRLLVIVSAVSGIIYDWVMIGNVVGAFWQVLLIAVNVVQIILLWTRDRLLDQGRWESVPEGTRLTEEGERPGFLTYLSEGTARIDTGNTEVARMEPGHFVGEMSLMGDGLASADVTVAEPARVWRIDRDRLERMRTQQPKLFALIEAGIALDLRAKVIATNTRAAAAPA
ncbi:cyclic nucleotide-binding domain-containing protein [Maritimibacter sp. DP07]|uniref:Cyclic nucleotide-binding domain-containing protein n=2 Tax=Maritimibacter harenae TaxID=2606218 RepID=A0A845M6T3_9RHOB|nr:cyclic nucleotide-binding domain-containing protein [Maritimibacter harenae]